MTYSAIIAASTDYGALRSLYASDPAEKNDENPDVDVNNDDDL